MLILRWRADLNAVDIETGETALMRACSQGDILRGRKLIGMHANVHRTDVTGATPLHAVCSATKSMEPKTHLEVVKLLAEAQANIDACTKDGWTAMQLAVQHKVTFASFLIKRRPILKPPWRTPKCPGPEGPHFSCPGVTDDPGQFERKSWKTLEMLLLPLTCLPVKTLCC